MKKGKQALRTFCRNNQQAIRELVLAQCPNAGQKLEQGGLRELEQWVLNDEGLYLWAMREGVEL